MLEQLFTAIGEQAVKAADPKAFRPAAEPEHVYYLDGARKEADPKPRDHKALDLETVIAFATRFHNEDFPSSVWFSRKGIVCLINDGTRRDRVSLDLTFSKQVLELQAMDQAAGRWYTQKELILLLRTKFCNCGSAAGDLVSKIRSVRFTANSESGGEVKHGKQSIGKSLQAELTAADQVPEYITLNVPIFANAFQQTADVRMAVEIDTETCRFQFIPLPQAIEYAISVVEGRIGELLSEGLKDAGVPVYYGSP